MRASLTLIALAGCSSASTFPCTADAQCVSGASMGSCLKSSVSLTKWCAFPSAGCAPSDLRWDTTAGDELAGTCVAGEAPDGGAPDGSAPMNEACMGITTNITGLWGTAPDNLYAVSQGGGICHRTSAGWSADVTDGNGSSLDAIAGGGAGEMIYAVGSQVFHNDARSSTWIGVTTLPGTAVFHSVAVCSASDVYLAGADTVNSVSTGAIFEGAGDIWHVAGPPGTTVVPPSSYYAVWCGGMRPIAVGTSGFITTRESVSWGSITSGTTVDLHALSGTPDQDKEYVIGGGPVVGHGPLASLTLTTLPGQLVSGLFEFSPSDVWVAANDVIHFDGTTWPVVPTTAASHYGAVWGFPHDVFVGGDGGAIVHLKR